MWMFQGLRRRPKAASQYPKGLLGRIPAGAGRRDQGSPWSRSDFGGLL